MNRKILHVLLLILLARFLFPAVALSKRPKGDDLPFLSEKIEQAKQQDLAGRYREAEEMYLELYQECKKEFEWNRRSENRWRDYMTSLRALIGYYYGHGKFQDVDWYFREYSAELEDDEEIGSMQWMLMNDIEDSVQRQVRKGNVKEAELVYLDLENRITSTLGFRHFLLGTLYRNMAAYYVQTGDRDKAAEYAKKAGTLMKER